MVLKQSKFKTIEINSLISIVLNTLRLCTNWTQNFT